MAHVVMACVMMAHEAMAHVVMALAGSPYQTSMSEAGQDKSLLVLDSHHQWAVAETVPLDLGPRHHLAKYPDTPPLDAITI